MSLRRNCSLGLAVCLLLAACGDDDEAPGGSSGGSSSAGTGGKATGGAGSSTGGTGAGGQAGGDSGAIVCDDVDVERAVAVAPDGKSVAFASCRGDEPSVVVRSIASGEETVLGPATAETAIEWLLDGKTVLFGSGDALFARLADASEDSATIGTAHVDEHRAFLERIDKDFDPRLMVLETDTDTRRLLVYRADDDYKTAKVLLEDPTLSGDLSHLSDSGRTLIPTLEAEDGTETYLKLRTNGMMDVFTMPFGPKDYALAPIGLGDTHDFAIQGTSLVRVELETGVVVELVPPDSGLLEGTAHIFDREDAPGKKYVYYIQNGDPTRRLRDGVDEPAVLAEANAVAQKLSADLESLIYLSDGKLYALPAEGGDSTLLVEAENDETTLSLAFSSTHSVFGYRVGSSLYRVSLEDSSSQVVATDVEDSKKMVYDGVGEALLFLDRGRLQRVTLDATEATLLKEGVTAFWPIPNSASLLVESDGQLEVLAP